MDGMLHLVKAAFNNIDTDTDILERILADSPDTPTSCEDPRKDVGVGVGVDVYVGVVECGLKHTRKKQINRPCPVSSLCHDITARPLVRAIVPVSCINIIYPLRCCTLYR